eukprot:Rmarinus@m.10388
MGSVPAAPLGEGEASRWCRAPTEAVASDVVGVVVAALVVGLLVLRVEVLVLGGLSAGQHRQRLAQAAVSSITLAAAPVDTVGSVWTAVASAVAVAVAVAVGP